ncbi:NAD(P)/FAD-dependent oxidoreductase [Mycoplasmatota bacterium]|nr:NAD(P)/FAD-dependent oxidoreductase [Mycoplasmatota bacterium]
MISTDVLIIGGGASGLLAGLAACDLGKQVVIVEGANRIAKKILTTGNGRCNITNHKIKMPYQTFHGQNPTFFQSVLNQFTVEDTINLFNIYGLPLTTLNDGKMYPKSLQASSVVNLFLMNIEERDIPVYLNSKVINIKKQNNKFLVESTNSDNQYFLANKVLIACGGSAAPNTGSDGSINRIIKQFGHNIIKPLPTIVQLKLEYKHLKAISGVRFDALASIMVNQEMKRQEYDEVLFTDYGISGPAILQLSRYASVGLSHNQEVKISLDLFSKQSKQEMKDYFDARFALFGHRTVFQSLIGVLHKKLIPVILKNSGITDIHKTCDSLTYQEKIKLYQTLKNWTFICNGTNGFKNAQSTIGGVDTTEVYDKTLQSKLVEGLYFSGEVLDVDGDCGGYNLQWAWSSGYLAGKNMSEY